MISLMLHFPKFLASKLSDIVFIMLINVKLLTRNKFHANLAEHEKSYNLEVWPRSY